MSAARDEQLIEEQLRVAADAESMFAHDSVDDEEEVTATTEEVRF